MARVCFLALIAGLLLEVYGLVIPEENTEAVFVSQQSAHTVLHRRRRYNSGHVEELQKDNLERECREEQCSREEAREVFENDEKTIEFWAGYIDGNQCNPQPCRNGGECVDGVGGYVCWCKPNFSGKNCEIDVNKQCNINNGGCTHFCEMKDHQPVCNCATGYQLGPDMKTCEPKGQFSCGQVIIQSVLPRTSNRTYASERSLDYDDNITQLFDAYDYSINDSHEVIISAATPVETTPTNVTEASREKRELDWAYHTSPNITAVVNTDTRIVGGDDALPGEIPWQVALMSYNEALKKHQPFCGGSLLSELWVITAAHCIVEATDAKADFIVRVGEHNVLHDDGSEKDHKVAEKHQHRLYDYAKSPYNHDIALLKLATPVELSNHRIPICLGPREFTENLLRKSSKSRVSGWGRMRFQGAEAYKLQKVEVPHVDRTECKSSSRYKITRFMFCAGYKSQQKDSCQGDSGGPHASNHHGTWFLTGIVSWGEECAKDGKYGIYTRVAQYYPWISQTTGIQIN